MYYHTITPGRFGSFYGSSHDYSDGTGGGQASTSAAAEKREQPQQQQRPSYAFATINYDSDPTESPTAAGGASDGIASDSYISQNKTVFSTNKKKKAKRLSIGSTASDS